MSLSEDLKSLITGDVDTSDEGLTAASHDASLFEVRPAVVVSPKDVEDVKKIVKYASGHSGVHLAARSACTDMSCGPLTESVVDSFPTFFAKAKEIVEKPQG